ncbi:type-2 angiotensin II receptor isoform 1-T2 [Clarias gariepinus]|uniref:type-2 angiotensin II receptor n=1 Tax=Clarias gariepinus TaxID=13013 RepID=UPI00234E0136|nr:type-2 angiotensin II receptor [Clarias gariepinus]XP_053341610.1 type-2 angiotensin II receptor [Clarias gariepinus]
MESCHSCLNLSTTNESGALHDPSNQSCDFLSFSSSHYQQTIIPVIYFLIFILGFLGNTLAVCVLGQKSLRCSVANTYLLNLALSDLIFISALVFWAVHYLREYDWPFGWFMCKLCGSLTSLNTYASIYFIMGMSIDRYRVIVYPLHSHCSESAYNARTVFNARCVCGVIWILAMLTTIPVLVFRQTHYSVEHNVTACVMIYPDRLWHGMLTLAKNIFGFVIPFLVIALCYSRIRCHLLVSPELVEPDSSRLERARRIAFAIVMAFFLCWFPFHTLSFMGVLQELGVHWSCEVQQVIRVMMAPALCLGFANSAINPLLYCFVGNRFRQQLRRLWKAKVQKIGTKRHDSLSMQISSVSRKLSNTKDTMASLSVEDKL